MADTELDETEEHEDGPKGLRAHVKRLESQLKEAQDRAAEAEGLRRELAFSKAGIDLNDAKVKYFVRGYDGELDADAIRKQAVEDGFLKAPDEPAPDPNLTASGRMDEAAAGEPDPARYAEFNERVKQAKSPDEILSISEEFGVLTSRQLQ